MAEFVEVMKKQKEMCDYYEACIYGCPIAKEKEKYKVFCATYLKEHPKEAEAIIMPWEKPVDWSKVEVDTKILVKSLENDDWCKRHFAKFENGMVYAWTCGLTSYTAIRSDDVTEWSFAKLAEEDEE